MAVTAWSFACVVVCTETALHEICSLISDDLARSVGWNGTFYRLKGASCDGQAVGEAAISRIDAECVAELLVVWEA
jgi:hypothetical protein